ncbi:hypothetical protein PENSPDRAFT_556154, partial [Peniophora sp. CONT]
LAPDYFIFYLEQHWLGDSTENLKVRWEVLWSAVHRQGRGIFEESDTNMLIEAYHHQLKWKFLRGKRNRRFDDLLYILTNNVLRYYMRRERRQDFGFEGMNLAQEKLEEV